jgi:hypothetical protein
LRASEYAAQHHAVASERGKDHFTFKVPYLHRIVPPRRDSASAVRRHRHRRDPIRMAFESAQLAPARQITHLKRLIPRRRDRPLPVRGHLAEAERT